MKRRIHFPVILAALCLAVSFFAEVQSACAGVIAVDVVESPFMVDATFEWTEEGTEEPFVLADLDDWFIQLRIFDNTETTGQWDLDVIVVHRIVPHGGNRNPAQGGFVSSFDAGAFDRVVNQTSAGFHESNIPDAIGLDFPIPPLHADLLFLDVHRVPLSSPASPNIIRVRARHVPEPESFGLIAVAVMIAAITEYARLSRAT